MKEVGTVNLTFDDRRILAARSAKNRVDPRRPFAFLVEPELSADGTVDDVGTLFLTNRECPFRCVFCDLWKNTTDERVPVGAIPAQIDFALARLPAARHVKLYNSGNFFDSQAIPPEDFSSIADRVRGFRTVIVENHPKLCGDACLRFRDLLAHGAQASGGRESPEACLRAFSRGTDAPRSPDFLGTQLEIALGLETVHPDVLPRLNKRMTVDDFDRAVEFLTANDIAVRAFVLLKPPFLAEADAVEWCLRSVEHAIAVGARCVSIIPTRAANGIMDALQRDGHFSPPGFAEIETAFGEALRQTSDQWTVDSGQNLSRHRPPSTIHRPLVSSPRVFLDTWDIQRLAACLTCAAPRAERLRQMNFTQRVLPPVACDVCRA